jgi:hypothetical protein
MPNLRGSAKDADKLSIRRTILSITRVVVVEEIDQVGFTSAKCSPPTSDQSHT